jgi:hypothetical protein
MIFPIAIYGNMDPINIPPMLAYIPAPWILWVIHPEDSRLELFFELLCERPFCFWPLLLLQNSPESLLGGLKRFLLSN